MANGKWSEWKARRRAVDGEGKNRCTDRVFVRETLGSTEIAVVMGPRGRKAIAVLLFVEPRIAGCRGGRSRGSESRAENSNTFGGGRKSET